MMKQWIVCVIMLTCVAACADTRNHVNNDATTWEKVRYQNSDADSQQ